ncbi:heme/hemin ABC transporter substrate-binding protein [Zobellella iuensis]|uniref:ABC transporter substrate-binding protein n=1 Tax=Zobellella iuensis TaxID=2803811 RepID=A0ABS1QWP8_9GAMM|nr:ABC transporter substrate-binding protein [Zobellella iuensis]MBL1379279.1 ABC transporter substrate-binding protein [Zobellella iuensis]
MKPLWLTSLLLVTAAAWADSPRLLSAGSGLTELVLALDAGDHLVAVDSTSELPAGLPLPRLGYHRQLSAEGMLAQQPSLVIGSEEMGPEQALALVRRAGVQVEQLPEALSVEQLQHNIYRLGELLGKGEAATALQLRVDEQARALAAGPVGKKVVFLLLGDGRSVQVAGHHTLADSLIRLAGGDNPAAAMEGYKPVAMEALVAMAPDIILVSRRHLEQQGDPSELLRQFPLLRRTPAAAAGAIVPINGKALIGGLGLSTLAEAERLHQDWLRRP